MRSFPFSPRSRGRKESDSANAYEPAWPAPAVGESGSAGQKRSWTPQELFICAHRATHGAKSRRKLESARELHSGLFLACPKMYDLRAPNPLSGSASSSDIYLARGQSNYYVDSSGFLGVGFNPTAPSNHPFFQQLIDLPLRQKAAKRASRVAPVARRYEYEFDCARVGY